jgi:NADH:ubiquinone oxidoreductase subunit B14.5a (Complex I-B14.5a)
MEASHCSAGGDAHQQQAKTNNMLSLRALASLVPSSHYFLFLFFPLSPLIGQLKIRNVIEFNGGVLDSSSYASGYDADFSAIGGYPRPYRLPPGSFPQARIPSGPAERAFDIKYYPRDARRNPWPGDKLADELSFTSEEAKALLATPELVKEPKLGSPGANNPDVIRYDPTGLRTAMTTNHASVQKSLSRHRAEHLPDPSW